MWFMDLLDNFEDGGDLRLCCICWGCLSLVGLFAGVGCWGKCFLN